MPQRKGELPRLAPPRPPTAVAAPPGRPRPPPRRARPRQQPQRLPPPDRGQPDPDHQPRDEPPRQREPHRRRTRIRCSRRVVAQFVGQNGHQVLLAQPACLKLRKYAGRDRDAASTGGERVRLMAALHIKVHVARGQPGPGQRRRPRRSNQRNLCLVGRRKPAPTRTATRSPTRENTAAPDPIQPSRTAPSHLPSQPNSTISSSRLPTMAGSRGQRTPGTEMASATQPRAHRNFTLIAVILDHPSPCCTESEHDTVY